VSTAALRFLAALVLGALVAASCGSTPDNVEASGPPSSEADAQSGADDPSQDSQEPSDADRDLDTEQTVPPTTAVTSAIDVVPGMPPVPDPNNIYSEIGPNNLDPAVAGHIERVYVPNEASGTVSVIDPATFEVIDTFQSGFIPQHVVPSYDLQTLFVLNNNGNTIVPIDPTTGAPGAPIDVQNPYNLYFMPDGSEAIVVAEGQMRLYWTDPNTFAVNDMLQTDCYGLNHMDFSIDGRFAIATCEFDGRLIKLDLVERQVVGAIDIDMSMSGKEDLIRTYAQPQDVRISPDGSTFYIADLISDGVYLIDGETFTQTGFIPTGVAAHGLYPSRDGTRLFVVNRGTNHIPPPGSFVGQAQGSITVVEFATNEVLANWPIPGAGSPDMGNLSADGTQLWLGARYDAEVYVVDTTNGELLARIPVGDNPHGLTWWPQPGRYSLGHTGNMR